MLDRNTQVSGIRSVVVVEYLVSVQVAVDVNLESKGQFSWVHRDVGKQGLT